MSKLARATHRKKQRHNEAEIGQAFSALAAISDNYIRQICSRVFLIMKRSMSFKLMMASKNARLDGCDEKIYDCYTALIRRYESAAAFYEKNGRHIVSTGVGDTVAGIYDVLASRVRLMAENAQETQNTKENPIKREKNEIVCSGVQFLVKNFDVMQRQVFTRVLETVSYKHREVCLTAFDIQAGTRVMADALCEIKRHCLEDMYAFYAESVKQCLSGLNDTGNRPVTTYYENLLNEELEILSVIVKVQVEAVETAVQKTVGQSDERTAASAFLSQLLEGYQALKKHVGDIEAGFQEAELKDVAPAAEAFESFAADIDAQTDGVQNFPTLIFEACKKEYDACFRNFEKPAMAALTSRIGREAARRQTQNIYHLQKSVSENVLMAEEMRRAFQDIPLWAETNRDGLLRNDCADIIAGICETINIKIESMTENTQSFSGEGRTLIDRAKAERPVPPEARQRAAEAAFKELFNRLTRALLDGDAPQQGMSPKTVKAALDACMEHQEIRELFRDAEKLAEGRRDAVTKKIIGFKRDCLLYEMSTFEEILQYSVSRLREADDAQIALFVDVIDGAQKTLTAILNKNNIFTIVPQPHEAFDGKAHEVIMAEPHEGFRKGEIIKVINSGYTQDDVVLMRANVIAAK